MNNNIGAGASITAPMTSSAEEHAAPQQLLHPSVPSLHAAPKPRSTAPKKKHVQNAMLRPLTAPSQRKGQRQTSTDEFGKQSAQPWQQRASRTWQPSVPPTSTTSSPHSAFLSRPALGSSIRVPELAHARTWDWKKVVSNVNEF